MSCYLDNAATTMLSPVMKEYLISVLDVFGNPSSVHSEGVKSNTMIENVRRKVQDFIHADSSDEIIFTSSGSASNTLGIQGFASMGNCCVLYSPTVHKSILKVVDSFAMLRGVDAIKLNVDSLGNLDIDNLRRRIRDEIIRHDREILVVVDYANSEIGTVQNISDISDIVHRRGCKLFVDCTGSISSIPLNVTELDIDMASFSAHKIGALKGVGVLYKKSDIEIKPLVFGSQEQGLFAGTENLLGILSLGKAIDLIDYSKTSHSRDFVWNSVKDIEGVSLIGAPLDKNRLINNLYICIEGVSGSDIVAMMDDIYKTQISTGSACNNGSPIPSSALLAIGMSAEDANSCVRISFSGNETEEELQEFCKNFASCIQMLRG